MRRTLVFCLFGLAVSIPGPSFAEPAPLAQADVATSRAGKLYDEGVELYRAGKFADAHVAYVAAWSLKKHYQIAGNLGDCEMRLGKYRDAAEHLTFYLREYPKDQPAENAEQARRILEEAQGHIGTLTVVVDEPGVDVLVDGKLVGSSPLVDPVFVDPGTRLVEVQRGKGGTSRTVEVSAGSTLTVRLAMTEARRTIAPAAPKGMPWAAIGSGAATMVSLGVGMGLLVKAGSVDAEAAAYRNNPENGITGPTYCAENPGRYECGKLHDISVKQIPYSWVGVGALALAGVGAGVTTFLLVRPSGKGTAPRVGLSVAPGPYFQVQGSF